MSTTRVKTEKEVLDEIVAGKYRDDYLVYERKSTDDSESQKNSFSYQTNEIVRYATREKLPITTVTVKSFCTKGFISESHSGFAEDDEVIISENGMAQFRIARPKFHQMLQFLNAGYFKGVIFLSWDRMSRNKADEMLMRKLMRKGVNVRFAFAEYDKSSAGELHMDVDGMFSAHHSRVTSEKVTATIRDSRSNGLCTNRAPIGYLNVGNMEHKPLDPERAPVIKRMFELYATGDWSLSDMVRFAKEENFTTVPMRRRRTHDEKLDETFDMESIPKVSRPVTENTISRILTNPFYIGLTFDENKNYIPSNSHEAITDDATFQKVQLILKKKQTSIHYTKKLDHPYRGIVRCAHCERVFTPYIQKGIHYFSSRCKDDCQNTLRNFNLKFINEKIEEVLSKLYYTEDELEDMDAKIGTGIALLEQKRLVEMERVERKKKNIREELAYIRSNKLTLLKTGAYTPESIVAEETKLDDGLIALQGQEQVSDAAMRATLADVKKLSELVKVLIPRYQFAKAHEKDEIVRVIFSELHIAENTLIFKCKTGFECFESRLNAFGDPTGSRTRLPSLKSLCPNR